jgi:Outer membrane protein beta-barrel domain
MNHAKVKIELIKESLMSFCLGGKVFMKTSVLILLLSVCDLTCVAQVSFGLKGGLNLNYMLYKYELNGFNSGSPDPNTNVGFHLGGYLQVQLSTKFFFQPELQFSRRGTGDVDLNYLELPLLVSFAPFKTVQFEMGPNVAFLVSASRPFFSDYKRNFDVGITGGLRYSLPKGFFISARYYYGLSPAHSVDLKKMYQSLNPNDPLILSSGSMTLDTYSRNIQFSVGYKIK